MGVTREVTWPAIEEMWMIVLGEVGDGGEVLDERKWGDGELGGAG